MEKTVKIIRINTLRNIVAGVVAGLLFLPSVAIGQDFQLSQYDAAPLFLNPAMTGMFDGQFRVHTQFRNQWNSVASKPFSTAAVSIDAPIKKFGLGAQVLNYRAGAGNYNVTSALLSFAYDAVLDKDYNHHLAMGIQGGILQKSINTASLTFGNQYTGTNGGSFDSGLSSGEVFNNTNMTVSDINAGFLYYYAKESSRVNPFLGFSAFHLTQPTESFLGSSNKLPLRYYFHGGVKINVNEKIQLLPKFLYMEQATASSYTASLLLNYYIQDKNTYLIFGPTYRSNDATIIEFGLRKGNYTGRVSYDINTSVLNKVTGYRGAFEISLTYTARKGKPNPLANCPRL